MVYVCVERYGVKGLLSMMEFRVHVERYGVGVEGSSSGMEIRVYIEQYGLKGLWFRLQARDFSLIPRV
jgi:hypothetical protein